MVASGASQPATSDHNSLSRPLRQLLYANRAEKATPLKQEIEFLTTGCNPYLTAFAIRNDFS